MKFDIAKPLKDLVSQMVFELGMVKLKPNDPFELTSGKLSPVYVDGRLWTQSTVSTDFFVSAMKWKIKEKNMDFDVIAGGVSAGVPFSERIAAALNEPSFYVRKSPKGYGKAAQIEGFEELSGKKVLLVEDLITTGGSKMKFIKGIRKAGGEVTDCVSFFDREQGGYEDLKDEGVRLHSILTLSELVDYGVSTGKLSEEDAQSLRDYMEDPESWEKRFRRENPDWE